MKNEGINVGKTLYEILAVVVYFRGNISGAVGRLGGQEMHDECTKLKTISLDQNTVPWNIRVQIKQNLDQWQKNAINFVETRAAKHVFTCIQTNSCVTITASSGVGKTATLQHVSLQMIDEGYDVLPITNPHDIVNFYNPNQKTLFVVDDFCGNYSINPFDLNKWENIMDRIEVLIQNKLTKIIVACRLQVYQDEKFGSLSIFKASVCNLLSENLCLLETEKQSIAELYLGGKATDIIQYCNLYDCFPLLCKLYSVDPKPNLTNFFMKPFSVYEAEIGKLQKKGNFGKYCALALCVIFNNELKEEWFTDEEVNGYIRTRIENTCEACRMDRSTSRLFLLDEMKTLESTFIKKENDVYKTLHDKKFDFLVSYFGQKISRCLIRNADSWLITERFLLANEENMDQYITILSTKDHQIYLQRMINDWLIGKVIIVLKNINLRVQSFRHRFLRYLKTHKFSFQKQLANTCDSVFKDSVLLQLCYYEDIHLIQWCIYHGVDVNNCNCFGVSPLYVAAQEGHTNVVKLLLGRNANINKVADIGVSDFFMNSWYNKTDHLKSFLDYKAGIIKCAHFGPSPLFVACQNNHKDIVKLLIDNKADINKCTYLGASPLYISSQEGHTEIVRLLLVNQADVDKCRDNGASPLYIACQNNQEETINLLLENRADVNKCIDKGVSPLYISCNNNQIKIVKVLLDNKADINKCVDYGSSPLFIACQKNHIELVKLLLDNKADINKCRDDGMSPLCIACSNNDKKIVKVLLEGKADINTFTNIGMTPLKIACSCHHLEIVKLILDDKAEIHKC